MLSKDPCLNHAGLLSVAAEGTEGTHGLPAAPRLPQPWMGRSAALLLELQTPALTTNHEAPTAQTAITQILFSFTNPDLL